MKAALYCRLSKEDEEMEEGKGVSESIQNQRSMLMRYAVENGYEIYQIYCDEDYSGMDRNRPAFRQMIEAAARREFDVILAKTQSRFTRDMELVEKYLHGKFIEWGVRFIAVVDHVDTADPANKKSRQINGLVNEWYLEDLSNNVRSVLTHKRKAGRYIASFALYGYRKDPADKGRLIVDPEAAEIVRKIFTLYLEGNGVTRIARLLNENGISSPTRYKREHGVSCERPGRCPYADSWGKATVYQMLCNRTYTGDLEQGRTRKISYKSKKVMRLPKEQWIVAPGTHEPIIAPQTFARVQQMLHARARGGGGGTIHPLAKKVFCGICGGAMEQTSSGSASKTAEGPRKYFRCRMSQRDPARCAGQAYLPAAELQQLVLERIQSYAAGLARPKAPDEGVLQARTTRSRQARQEELVRLQAEIGRRRKAMQELYLDKSGGLIGPEQFAQMNDAFLKEVTEMEKRCKGLAEKPAETPEAGGGRQSVPNPLRDAAALRILDRELVTLLVDKIIVYPPDEASRSRKIEVIWNF